VDTYLVLLLSPFLVTAAIYAGTARTALIHDFRGLRAFKLLATIFWLACIYLYFTQGTEWFCDTCRRAGMIFLGLSIGCALVTCSAFFAPLLASTAKTADMEIVPVALGVVIIGLVLVRLGV
jgi:hypothetical protein